MTKRIEEAWKTFAEDALQNGARPEVLDTMRDMYYLGATEVLKILDKASRQPDSQRFLQVRDDLIRESKEFLRKNQEQDT